MTETEQQTGGEPKTEKTVADAPAADAPQGDQTGGEQSSGQPPAEGDAGAPAQGDAPAKDTFGNEAA
jgi:hypothetical protein